MDELQVERNTETPDMCSFWEENRNPNSTPVPSESDPSTSVPISSFEPYLPLDPLSPSPLAKLPPELLADVFIWVKNELQSELWLRGLDWMRRLDWVALVCRYWREVAMSTPLLWRSIIVEFPRQLRFLQEMLRRSAGAPLHLDLDVEDAIDMMHYLQPLLPERKSSPLTLLTVDLLTHRLRS